MTKFVTKNAYLDIFDQKSLIWIILGYNFKNAIIIFEISALQFA